MKTRFRTVAGNTLLPGTLPAFRVELRGCRSEISSSVGPWLPTVTLIAAAERSHALLNDRYQPLRFGPSRPTLTAIPLWTLSDSPRGVAGIRNARSSSMLRLSHSIDQSLKSLIANFGISIELLNHTLRRGASVLYRSLCFRIRQVVSDELAVDRTKVLGRQERTNNHEENNASQCIADRRMSDCDRRRRPAGRAVR